MYCNYCLQIDTQLKFVSKSIAITSLVFNVYILNQLDNNKSPLLYFPMTISEYIR